MIHNCTEWIVKPQPRSRQTCMCDIWWRWGLAYGEGSYAKN